jgi:hypothetical protein
MTKIIVTLFALTSFQAFAGDNGGGRLSCLSESGRTKVEGMAGVPYNGSGSAMLIYSIDGAAVEFNPTKIVSPTVHIVDVVDYTHRKSYVVRFITSTANNSPESPDNAYADGVFTLRSLPNTMTQVRPDVLRFKAVIPAYTSVNPRLGNDLSKYIDRFDQDIQVNCELDLTI